MSEETESEQRLTRTEIAAYLGGLSAGFDSDDDVRLMIGDDEISVSPPDECSFEVEYEREEDEEEIEIEIEWSADSPEDETAAEDETPAEDEGEEGESEEAEETELSPASSESQATFQLFEDRSGEWRWRLVHRNGNVIATSGEGYTRKPNAEKGMRSVKRNAQGAATETE